MISLVIYVLSFVVIIGIIGSITVFFSKGTKDVNMSTGASSEYNKFNLYMLEYTKNGYELSIGDDNVLTFSKGNEEDKFRKEGNMLYFNKIKLCENVDEFEVKKVLENNGKEMLKTKLNINGIIYTTDYLIEKKIWIPEGLEVGKVVSYNPSGTYNWQAKYASSDLAEGTGDVSLNSADGKEFNIKTWKVLSIDRATGIVKMVPEDPTTGTVRLEGAQGYNNGVKLLNEACSNLYSDFDKGITARSINIEDIEGVMDQRVLETQKSNANYEIQISSPYTQGNSYYPLIYGKERLASIDGNIEKSGLGVSEQNEWIGRTDTDRGKTATEGKVQANTNIQPYNMKYSMDNSNDFSTALGKYASILRENKTYWIASRCIYANQNLCYFDVRVVDNGILRSAGMYQSNTTVSYNKLGFFPVVFLNVELIKGDTESGFKVD